MVLTDPRLINIMNNKHLNIIGYVLVIISIYFVISTALGIYNNYSIVPHWDMWTAYFEFYFKTTDQGWSAWWEQHNEHRLVLAKAFFWIDMHYFDGNKILLFTFNLLFSAFLSIALATNYHGVINKKIIYSLIIIFCFSWLQFENYIWAFQSQFFLSYLIPLCSFISLNYYFKKKQEIYLLLSLILGVISSVTMANGVMVLPLLVVMGAFLAIPKRFIFYYFSFSFLVINLYFFDFIKLLDSHISLLGNFNTYVENPDKYGYFYALKQMPLKTIAYYLKYLSGPFSIFLETKPFISIFFGFFILVISIFLCITILIKNFRSNIYHAHNAIVWFSAYLFGTAIITTLGRVYISQDIPTRYLTPSLLIWCCAIILYFSFFKNKKILQLGIILITIPLLALIPNQANTLQEHPFIYLHKVAVVSSLLKVQDEPTQSKAYFNISSLNKIINEHKLSEKSIFSEEYIKNVINLMGSTLDELPEKECMFYIDKHEAIKDGWHRLQGWYYDVTEKTPIAYIINSNNKIVGLIIIGEERADVANHLKNPKAKNTGFIGFISPEANTENLKFISNDCSTAFKL